jgi:translation elongation factor EF-4
MKSVRGMWLSYFRNKVAREVHVGDTITNAINPGEPLKGYEQVKPWFSRVSIR